MANPFVHIELNSTDVQKAKSFYGQLFDWKLEDVPMGPMTYTMIGVGAGTGGGITQQMMPGAPSAWLAASPVVKSSVSPGSMCFRRNLSPLVIQNWAATLRALLMTSFVFTWVWIGVSFLMYTSCRSASTFNAS